MTTENLAAQIGELKGTVNTLQSNITSWMEHWSRQDAAAMSSRRHLHQRVEKLSTNVAGMNATLSSVKDDVEDLKTDLDEKVMPTISAYKTELAQRAGMWLMGKFFWAVGIAICTVIGFVAHLVYQIIFSGKLPFLHP